uniref:Coat protein n=1 Tax=Pepper ringspot virus TaxID=31750 RepID=W0RYA2_9VIRU|nr:coat protein [Pepper ringspot virus]
MAMYDDEFDTKASDLTFSPWVEVENWKDVTTRLRAIKFALQADRDKIPGVLSDLKTNCPYSAFKRFPDKSLYSVLPKEAVIAVAQIQAASAFKRRADEKNAVSGLVSVTPTQVSQSASSSAATPVGLATVKPPRESDSAFQEDTFSYAKFDDASTAFHKALAYLEGLSLRPTYRRKFEKDMNVKWGGSGSVPSGAPAGGSSGSAPPTSGSSGSGAAPTPPPNP